MHGFEEFASTPDTNHDDKTPWYKLLNRYHWFVLIVAALGWLFDTMDQQLFALARKPAMVELLTKNGVPPDGPTVGYWAGIVTSIFLIGWATGGLFFGMLGDRIGRAKVMLWTILIYSFCTGLSAVSFGFWDFAFYRFLTGLGVGGEFAVGVSLVAEVMPHKARPFALGLLQALSAVGNISAALINMWLGVLEGQGAFSGLEMGGEPVKAWRIMFIIGTVPALLAILIRRNLKEPETWQKVAHDGAVSKQLGSFQELLGDPKWRKNALAGLALAFAGVVGLWGIGFFSYDLFDSVLQKKFKGEGFSDADIAAKKAFWIGMTSVMQNIGGFLGIYAYSYVTHYIGRKPAFAISFVAATLSTGLVFSSLSEISQIFWMIPLMGFCQLALFGGYAIYFPELFPTRLRSTGTSFCYNVGRFAAAAGPMTLGALMKYAFKGYAEPLPIRYAGVTMCCIFLLGLVALPFAPETKGQPLPE